MFKFLKLFVAFTLISSVALAEKPLTASQEKAVQNVVKKYIQAHPEVIVKALVKLRDQEMQQQITQAEKAAHQYADALLHAKHSPLLGNKRGDVTVIEFLDYRCGHCREMSNVITQLIHDDAQIRVVIKQLPIFSGESLVAAKAALAAKQQGHFAAFHKALLSADMPLTEAKIDTLAKESQNNLAKLKATMTQSWVSTEIQDNMKIAQALKLMGTPAFVIMRTDAKGQSVIVPGATSLQQLKSSVAQLRKVAR